MKTSNRQPTTDNHFEEAFFTLSKSKLAGQLKILEDLGLTISYSYKTNRQIGDILQVHAPKTLFSLHAIEEIPMIKDD